MFHQQAAVFLKTVEKIDRNNSTLPSAIVWVTCVCVGAKIRSIHS